MAQLLDCSILLNARLDELNHETITLLSRVNGNYEMATQNNDVKFFFPPWDLKASVLPMSYADNHQLPDEVNKQQHNGQFKNQSRN